MNTPAPENPLTLYRRLWRLSHVRCCVTRKSLIDELMDHPVRVSEAPPFIEWHSKRYPKGNSIPCTEHARCIHHDSPPLEIAKRLVRLGAGSQLFRVGRSVVLARVPLAAPRPWGPPYPDPRVPPVPGEIRLRIGEACSAHVLVGFREATPPIQLIDPIIWVSVNTAHAEEALTRSPQEIWRTLLAYEKTQLATMKEKALAAYRELIQLAMLDCQF